MTPTKHAKSNEFLAALANLAVLVIVAAAAAVSLIRLIDHLGPAIGDVLAFDPAKADAAGMEVRIIAWRADASSAQCVLDGRAMRKTGGSLLVETAQFEPTISFRVHWAGGRTSDDEMNCGATAELLLNQSDLMILKMVALK